MILMLNVLQLMQHFFAQLELQMELLLLVVWLEEHVVLIKLRINVELMQAEVYVFGIQI